jgi:hypothetical protein
MGKNSVQGLPKQNVSENLISTNRLGVMMHVYNSSYWEVGRKIIVCQSGRKCETLFEKMPKAKRAGGVAQVVESTCKP